MEVNNPKPITSVFFSLLSSMEGAARSLLTMPSFSSSSNVVAVAGAGAECVDWLPDSCIIVGLIAVQVINSGYMVLLIPFLSIGVNPLFLIALGSLGTSLFVFPLAIFFEREIWPKRLSISLVAQFIAISLGGVTMCQVLLLKGMAKTSPAIASAMPNLAPGIIFVLAACFRFEKVEMRCIYTKLKILGTLVCLGGAICMSFLQSPPVTSTETAEGSSYLDWVIGCSYLLCSVIVLSCSTILQAAVMVHFPAPFTLAAIFSSTGGILTILVEIIVEGKLDVGKATVSLASVVPFVLVGSIVVALCLSFQTWCVKKKGPLFVSIFNPIQTVCSAILSALLLGKIVSIGSFAGMLMMFLGLYMVLWAKKKECSYPLNPKENMLLGSDIENPLLSET